MRILFFLASTAIGGGTRIFFELCNRLAERGHQVEIQSFAGPPGWFPVRVPFEQVIQYSAGPRDLVVVSHLFQVPLVLQVRAHQPLLWLCQGYEGSLLEPAQPSDPAELMRALALPFRAAAISRPVQAQLEARGKPCAYVPCALDRERFQPCPPAPLGQRRRILLVGDPDIPAKGFPNALAALTLVSQAGIAVELVVVTRNLRWQSGPLPFPVQLERRPALPAIAPIMASCHALCCPSRYEGLGLPALEAMALGIPVVSTRNVGVDEYGLDEVNLLLADPGQPEQLARQLLRLLGSPELSQRLRQAGLQTVAERFFWPETLTSFEGACEATRAPGPTAQLQEVLEGLERIGLYTPLEVEKDSQSNQAELRQLWLTREDRLPHEYAAQLRRIRDRAYRRLSPQRPIFQAHYDACQLLLAFPEQPAAWAALARLCP